MVIFRFRKESEAKDLLKKLKKMHRFTKELVECVEDKIEEDEEDDDEDEKYRYDEDEHMDRMNHRGAGSYRRYRRGM